MLLYKEFKSEALSKLRVGSFFENAVITDIVRKNDYLSITTSAGDVYTFHYKPAGYSVFCHRKDLKELRRARDKANRDRKS